LKKDTWFGYEVRGIILLRNLQGAIRLDRRKFMSVHVSTCTSYDINAVIQLCRSCGADKTWVFLRLVAKMSHRFLEQRMNIKFCVKLGNNAKSYHWR
jgi:Leu/Phe-tRNA-protein transferase